MDGGKVYVSEYQYLRARISPDISEFPTGDLFPLYLIEKQNIRKKEA